MSNIRIHAPGMRSTDSEKAKHLASVTPKGFRVAQELLVAAEKFRTGKGGLFSSRRSRIRNLQERVYELIRALDADSYSASAPGERNEVETLFDYLSKFSDAFPNWQPEYETLNRFIPECF